MFTQELFVILFGWATLLSGYAPDENEPLPELVYNVQHSWFVENRCGGVDTLEQPCLDRAVYRALPHPVILISELVNDYDLVLARSVVIHEYDHYLADVNGHLDFNECESLERHAYTTQQMYLKIHDSEAIVGFKPGLDCA